MQTEQIESVINGLAQATQCLALPATCSIDEAALRIRAYNFLHSLKNDYTSLLTKQSPEKKPNVKAKPTTKKKATKARKRSTK